MLIGHGLDRSHQSRADPTLMTASFKIVENLLTPNFITTFITKTAESQSPDQRKVPQAHALQRCKRDVREYYFPISIKVRTEGTSQIRSDSRNLIFWRLVLLC